MTPKKGRDAWGCLVPALFFTGLWLFGQTGMYNDSHQYIAMHIHREPLYPFFLWIFRCLFGQEISLEVVRFLQNVLAAFAVIWLTDQIRSRFALKRGMTLAVSLLLLLPHLITPLFSASHLVFTNGIVSEALGLSLFYLFCGECLSMLFAHSRRAAVRALVLSVLLALTRGQMLFTILLWMVCAAALAIGAKQKKRLFLVLLCTALAFGSRSVLVKSYNLAFNGHFIQNTFGNVGMLANLLYAADRTDGERIADKEARELFFLSYDLAEEAGANYKAAPAGFMNRAAHLEKWHDTLKFELLEEPWRAYHDSIGFQDYILENVESDRIAGEIMKGILPAVAGRWLYDYLALSVYGLIRSVAVVHPLLNWYALLSWCALLFLLVRSLKKKRDAKAAWLALFSVLAVAANVYATSLIIMCLSRYMIYGLPLFYISGLLLLREWWLEKRKAQTG